MLVHVYPIMTKIIPIIDPDYGPNPNYGSGLRIRDYGPRITDPGARIWITNLDYGSGLRIWITDYGSGQWNTDRDEFGILPHFYTDNFSRAIQPIAMTRHLEFWTRCALDEV